MVVVALAVACEVVLNNWFLLVWIVYVILPILDYLVPLDHTNIAAERKKTVEKDTKFLAPLYSLWVMDFAILYWVLFRIQ